MEEKNIEKIMIVAGSIVLVIGVIFLIIFQAITNKAGENYAKQGAYRAANSSEIINSSIENRPIVDAPANVRAEHQKAVVTLKWDAVNGAESYSIYRGEENYDTKEIEYELIESGVTTD